MATKPKKPNKNITTTSSSRASRAKLKAKEFDKLLKQATRICDRASDQEIQSIVKSNIVNALLKSILDTSKVAQFSNIGEFFFRHKNRSKIIADIHSNITTSHAVKSTRDGHVGYVSPCQLQWFEDAVVILEGTKPFEGLIGKYKDNRMSYAVAARDIAQGEKAGKDAFVFIDLEDLRSKRESERAPQPDKLDEPINDLIYLLESENNVESDYQNILMKHHWIFGLQYQSIQRHEHLDDKNIPDFTGVRTSDQFRDIFEIKPPLMKLFRIDGEFSSQFNDAWNQAERYLNFARQESDYLRRKGFRFSNPRCTLICGYNLNEDQIKLIRLKEEMNPNIQLRTFNDILTFMRSTVMFIKSISAQRQDSPTNQDSA